MFPSDNKQFYVLIGQRISVRRAVMGMSRKTLAKKINRSPRQLLRYEKGESTMYASTLDIIAKELQVSVGCFLREDGGS